MPSFVGEADTAFREVLGCVSLTIQFGTLGGDVHPPPFVREVALIGSRRSRRVGGVRQGRTQKRPKAEGRRFGSGLPFLRWLLPLFRPRDVPRHRVGFGVNEYELSRGREQFNSRKRRERRESKEHQRQRRNHNPKEHRPNSDAPTPAGFFSVSAHPKIEPPANQ